MDNIPVMNIDELRGLLTPTDEEKSQAQGMGLLNFGAAMLANPNGGSGWSRLGEAIPHGTSAYTAARNDLQDRRIKDFGLKMQLAKMQQDQDTINGIANYMNRGGQTQGQTGIQTQYDSSLPFLKSEDSNYGVDSSGQSTMAGAMPTKQVPVYSPPQQTTNPFKLTGDPAADRLFLMADKNAVMTNLLKRFEPTERMRNDAGYGVDPALGRQNYLAEQQKNGTMSFQPNQLNVMPNGKAVVAPDFAKGTAGGIDPTTGLPFMNVISGAPQALSQVAMANELPKAQLTPYKVDLASGPVLTNQATAAGFGGNGKPFNLQGEGAKASEVERGKFYGTNYTDLQKGAMDANTNIAKLDRISTLLDGVNTGKLTPTGTQVAAYAKAAGFDIDPNLGNKQAAAALSNEIALQLRNPSGGAGMPGSMSDSDRAFLTTMTPSLSNTPEGNKLIIDAHKKIAQRSQDIAELARNYNGGNLDNGFYKVVQDYANSHPLFPKVDNKTSGSSTTFDSLPPPNSYKGRSIKAPDGSVLTSNGLKWMKQ